MKEENKEGKWLHPRLGDFLDCALVFFFVNLVIQLADE